jgi:hypothetical protein
MHVNVHDANIIFSAKISTDAPSQKPVGRSVLDYPLSCPSAEAVFFHNLPSKEALLRDDPNILCQCLYVSHQLPECR